MLNDQGLTTATFQMSYQHQTREFADSTDGPESNIFSPTSQSTAFVGLDLDRRVMTIEQ